MQLRACIMGSVGALVVSTMTIPAQAAPISAKPLQAGTINIEQVALTCWRRNGRRHCGYGYGPRYRVYGYPEAYRTGSGRWWGEMDREGRGGRGRR
jgi:hypothetical protein